MIQKLELENFRNYKNISIDFTNGINLIIGPNGSGKTSILEAIFMLVMTKSFRTNITKYVIKNGEEYAKIKALIDDENKLEFILDNRLQFDKIYKHNGIKKDFIEIFGIFNIVLFEPEDLNLILMEPEKRRKYFNVFISQIDKKYFEYLSKYNKCIKTRNKLLNLIQIGKAKKDEIEFWDQQLIKYGSYIIMQRAYFLNILNDILSQKYYLLSNKDSKININYKMSINYENEKIENLKDENTIKKIFTNILKHSLNLDLNTGKTNFGIHKDDFIFNINNYKAKYFASRGEIRSIIISLKIIEIELLKQYCNKTPIILLDDIFSELDEYRSNYLLDIISKYQTIITSVSKINYNGIKKIIELNNSCITYDA